MNRKEQLRELVQASKSIYLDHTLSNKAKGDQLSSIEASMRELLRQPLTPTLYKLPEGKKETVQNFLMQHHAATFMILFMLLNLLVAMEIATALSLLAGSIDKTVA